MANNFLYPILKSHLENIRTTGELTVDHVRNLNAHFSNIIIESLEFVKSKAVTKITSKSGRYLFKVSQNNLHFACILQPLYCNCKEFLTQVIFAEEAMMCAHLMAVYLSDALNLLVLINLEDIPFAEEYYILTEHK